MVASSGKACCSLRKALNPTMISSRISSIEPVRSRMIEMCMESLFECSIFIHIKHSCICYIVLNFLKNIVDDFDYSVENLGLATVHPNAYDVP